MQLTKKRPKAIHHDDVGSYLLVAIVWGFVLAGALSAGGFL